MFEETWRDRLSDAWWWFYPALVKTVIYAFVGSVLGSLMFLYWAMLDPSTGGIAQDRFRVLVSYAVGFGVAGILCGVRWFMRWRREQWRRRLR